MNLEESKYFKKAEFECSCFRCKGKHRGAPTPALLDILEAARERFKRPMIISSGFRCAAHNAEVGGVFPSEHTLDGDLTDAADIIISFSRDRFELIGILYALFVPRIGIAKSFIHIGASHSLDQDVIWLYA